MKKTILMLLSVAIIGGCKKAGSSATTTTTTSSGNSTWTVGDKTYTAKTNVDGKEIILASSTVGESMVVAIGNSQFPTTNDSFKLISPVMYPIATGYLDINVIVDGATYYSSSNVAQPYVSFNVASGKFTMTIPKIWVYVAITGKVVADSLQLSATINQ